MLRGICIKSKNKFANQICNYFAEINEEPIIFHWKYNLNDINISEEITVEHCTSKS